VFKLLGILVAIYVVFAAYDGRVYAERAWLRRPSMVERSAEPRWFWTVIAIYGALAVALITVF
jgi:hypothetical protein